MKVVCLRRINLAVRGQERYESDRVRGRPSLRLLQKIKICGEGLN